MHQACLITLPQGLTGMKGSLGALSCGGEETGKVGGWIPDTKLQPIEHFDYENTYSSFISCHLNTHRDS